MSSPQPPQNPRPRPTIPACAACKYMRRGCSLNCPLAPYFPADRQSDFYNVRRRFGVEKVAKLLNEVAPHERENTIESIVYEANIFAADPAGSCRAVVADLRRKIDICTAELEDVNRVLALYKNRTLMQINLNQNPRILNQDPEIQENVPQFFNDDNQ